MTPTSYLLNIQKFLKEHTNPQTARDSLQSRFKINITEDRLEFTDGDTEPVWIYNYDPIRARGGTIVENEARGLILDENHEVVAMSFRRFMNAHEGHAAKIHWASARAERKLDGSLITIYCHRGEYFISTRRSAMAAGGLSGFEELSFREAVTSALINKLGDNPFAVLREHDKEGHFCWVFEYTSPYNRIVTPYDTDELVLLTIINKTICRELPPSSVNMIAYSEDIHRPETRFVYNKEEVDDLIAKLHPLEEGFVVVDGYCDRIKVKNPSYIPVSKIVNTVPEQLSVDQFSRVVLTGEGPEVASYFPEYKGILGFLQEVLEDILENVDQLWKEHGHLQNRKDFAEAVKYAPFSFLLFEAWDGKISEPEDALNRIKPNMLSMAAEIYQKHELEAAFQKAAARR